MAGGLAGALLPLHEYAGVFTGKSSSRSARPLPSRGAACARESMLGSSRSPYETGRYTTSVDELSLKVRGRGRVPRIPGCDRRRPVDCGTMSQAACVMAKSPLRKALRRDLPGLARPRRSEASSRLPLTITLSRENFAFLDSCASLNEFDSVDQIFDAALACYRRHVHALTTYAEEQVYKGYSLAEVVQSIETETLVTKVVPPRSARKRQR